MLAFIEQSKTSSSVSKQSAAIWQLFTHKKIIYHTLANKRTFDTYFLANNLNKQQGYQSFKHFLESYEGFVKQVDKLEAKIAMLTEKLKEQGHVKSCVERVFTYVEKQLACFQANSHATSLPTHPLVPPTTTHATPSASNLTGQPQAAPPHGTPHLNPLSTSGSDNASNKSHKPRMIKILDLLKFHRKPALDLISYKDWLLQMTFELQANVDYISTESFKMSYI